LLQLQTNGCAAVTLALLPWVLPVDLAWSAEKSPEVSMTREETEASDGTIDLSFSYAQAISPRDDIMRLASFYRTRLECHRSFLDGLGVLYEFMPAMERTSLFEQERLTMQRQTWGWTFKGDLLEATGGMLSQLSFQPRLGLLDLDYRVSTIDGKGQDQTARFETMGNLAIGLHIGVSRRFVSLGHEISGSYDRTTLGARGSQDASVVSQKLGYRLSYVIQRERWFQISLVAFGDGERLVINRDPLYVLRDAVAGLYEVTFRFIHIGGGMVLSW
jgi:hypothetical protein